MDRLEWFYVDIDGQSKGPITTKDVKQLPLDVFVWNGSTVNTWTELKDIQSLLYNDNRQYNEKQNEHKPTLENENTVESPSVSSIQNEICFLDYRKYTIPQNNKVETKSNLSTQLKNITIPQNDLKKQKSELRLDIKQSETEYVCPPPFSPCDVISDKLEQIMDTLQIAEHARGTMRKWTQDKKLQIILQYDFKQKSELLFKKKNINKKKKSLFKKYNKKKKSSLNKNGYKSEKDKEWKFGFNPLPITMQQNKKSSKNKQINMNKISQDEKAIKNNEINMNQELQEIDIYMTDDDTSISYDEDTKDPEQIDMDSLETKNDNETDFDNYTDSFIAAQPPMIFSMVNENKNAYDYDVNTMSIQHDYLNMINENNSINSNNDNNDDESDASN